MNGIINNQVPDLTVQDNHFFIDIQHASSISEQADDAQLQFWVHSVLQSEPFFQNKKLELCIRIVDEAEMCEFNSQYRQRSGPTNVLSFPAEIIPEIQERRLGDLVICAPIVNQQAQQQNKTTESHWAHMVVHGLLHLCGYDHMNATDAAHMEQREIQILKKLGFSDPYEVK